VTWTCLLQLTRRWHSPCFQWQAGWGFNNSKCKWHPSHRWFYLQWYKEENIADFFTKELPTQPTNIIKDKDEPLSSQSPQASQTTLLALSIRTLTFCMPMDSHPDQNNSQTVTQSKGPQNVLVVCTEQWPSNPGGWKEFKTKTRSE
jgi:hypothetical protein